MSTILKLKADQITWNSDKEPNGAMIFISDFGSFVRTIPYGDLLENMLGAKAKGPFGWPCAK